MIPKLARVTMISAAVFALALVANAQSTDPFVGTWRLNVAKSTYSPGPVPKSITTTTQRNVASADGKTRTVTTTGTDAQGQKVHNVGVFERQ